MKKILLGLMLVLCVFGASLSVGCDKSDDVNPGPGPEIVNPPSDDDDNSNPSDDNKGDDSGNDNDDENSDSEGDDSGSDSKGDNTDSNTTDDENDSSGEGDDSDNGAGDDNPNNNDNNGEGKNTGSDQNAEDNTGDGDNKDVDDNAGDNNDDTNDKDKEWNGLNVNELCDAIREEVLLNLSLESGTPTINMQDGGFILTLDFSIEAPCLDDSYIELIEECVDLTLSQYSLSYIQTISILDDIVTIIISNN